MCPTCSWRRPCKGGGGGGEQGVWGSRGGPGGGGTRVAVTRGPRRDRRAVYLGDRNSLNLTFNARNQGEGGAYEAELHVRPPPHAQYTGVLRPHGVRGGGDTGGGLSGMGRGRGGGSGGRPGMGRGRGGGVRYGEGALGGSGGLSGMGGTHKGTSGMGGCPQVMGGAQGCPLDIGWVLVGAPQVRGGGVCWVWGGSLVWGGGVGRGQGSSWYGRGHTQGDLRYGVGAPSYGGVHGGWGSGGSPGVGGVPPGMGGCQGVPLVCVGGAYGCPRVRDGCMGVSPAYRVGAPQVRGVPVGAPDTPPLSPPPPPRTSLR